MFDSGLLLLAALGLLTAVAAVGCQTQGGAGIPSGRTALKLTRTLREPPALDGSLDGWDQAPCVSLVTLKDGVPAKPATEVRVAYDRDNLYVHFTCHEPATDKLVATGGGRDDDLWQDDSVEVFLAPEPVADFEPIPASTHKGWKTFHYPVHGEREYWHLAVNCRGVRLDARNETRINPVNRTFDGWFSLAWDREWTAKVKVGKGRWVAAMAIPFKALGRSSPGSPERWRANFCRTRYAGGRPRYFAWSPGGAGFHDTSAHGELAFAAQSFKSAEEMRADAERLIRLGAFVQVERIALALLQRDKEYPPRKSYKRLAKAAKVFLDEFGPGAFADGAAFLLAAATRDADKLAEVIRKYPKSEWVDDAAANLGRKAPEELIDLVGKRLSDPSAAVRANAARALTHFALRRHPQRAKYLEEVVARIKDPDPIVRLEAAYMANVYHAAGRYLNHGRDEEAYYTRPPRKWKPFVRSSTPLERKAIPLLIDNLGHSNVGVRVAAIWSLRNMGDESAIPHLLRLFRDPGQSGFVRSKVVEAMGVITQAVRSEKKDPALDAELERKLGQLYANVWKDPDGATAEYGVKYFPFFKPKYIPGLQEAAGKARHKGARLWARNKLAEYEKRGVGAK